MELKVPCVIYSPFLIRLQWHYHSLTEITELKLLWLV